MIASFALANPHVWFHSGIYSAIAVTLPTYSIIAVALVFVIVSGEIDLSFGSTVTLTGMVFAYAATSGIPPYVSALLAVLAGMGIGAVNGILVAYLGLSSLVVTLGMSFLWDGLVNIVSNGQGTPLNALSGSSLNTILTAHIGSLPVQMLWALGFAVLLGILFGRHKLGVYACFAGDNLDAAREMGINIRLVKSGGFILVGLASGMVGVLLDLININFYPETGSGLLLPILAAVFVGGTPMYGGVGTVAGAVVGSVTITSIAVGIITSGFSGFYTNFLYGVVIVLSVAIHRLARIQRHGPNRLFAFLKRPFYNEVLD